MVRAGDRWIITEAGGIAEEEILSSLGPNYRGKIRVWVLAVSHSLWRDMEPPLTIVRLCRIMRYLCGRTIDV